MIFDELFNPLPETCTLLRVYSPKVKDGFYASQHPSIPASGFAGLGCRFAPYKQTGEFGLIEVIVLKFLLILILKAKAGFRYRRLIPL
ncbi:MAG: hypothetical protein RBT11_10930 [Desulfobacterales bacterium]|jgi:hypothetical protein|nr:hypothetical protein [Desulfobacterales bacterium]